MHLPAFVLRGEAANTTLWKVIPLLKILIDWKTDVCWENNTSVEPVRFSDQKMSIKIFTWCACFFISVKKTITNIKQSWWSMVYKKNFCSEMDSRVDLQPFFFSSNQSILSASGSQAKVNGAWDGPECFVNDNVIHNQKKSLAWMWFSLFVTSIMAFFIGRLVNVL